MTVAVPLVALAVALGDLAARARRFRAGRPRARDRYNAELEAAVHARTKDLAATQLEVVLAAGAAPPSCTTTTPASTSSA